MSIGKEVCKELTTEALRKLFKSNFELAHFAIRMGRFCVHGGQNSLIDILEEVRRHPSEGYLQDLELLEKENKDY